MLVTLSLVAILFGERRGRATVARPDRGGRATASFATPPAPAPADRRLLPGRGPAGESQSPPPPEDVLKELDPDERNNVRVYAAANKSVVNITTEAEGFGFFGDETSTGTGFGIRDR